MNDKPLNPLSGLAEFSGPKQHSSGRRELRAERNAMGFTIHARPKNEDEALKARLTGEMVETLPIRRAQPKVSKKQQAKMKREQKRTTNPDSI